MWLYLICFVAGAAAMVFGFLVYCFTNMKPPKHDNI